MWKHVKTRLLNSACAVLRANQALLGLCRKTREKTMTIALRVWRNSSCGPPRRRTRPDPSGQWISWATNQKKPQVKRLGTSRNFAFQLGFQETVCFIFGFLAAIAHRGTLWNLSFASGRQAQQDTKCNGRIRSRRFWEWCLGNTLALLVDLDLPSWGWKIQWRYMKNHYPLGAPDPPRG